MTTSDTSRELATNTAAMHQPTALVSDAVAAAVQAERERQDRYRQVLREQLVIAVGAAVQLRDALIAVVEGIDEQWMHAPDGTSPNDGRS